MIFFKNNFPKILFVTFTFKPQVQKKKQSIPYRNKQ